MSDTPRSAADKAIGFLFLSDSLAGSPRTHSRALLVDNGERGSDQKAMTFDADDLSALMMDLRCAESDLAANRIEIAHLREAFRTMEKAANERETECERLRDQVAYWKVCNAEILDRETALRQRHETAVERAARFCYLEGWNDVAHERGADFNRAWAAWLASEDKKGLDA